MTQLRMKMRRWGRTQEGWLYVLPALLVLLVVIVFPSIRAIYISFGTLQFPSLHLKFEGLGNYHELVADPLFRQAVVNTVIWTVGTVMGQIGLGLIAALVLNEIKRGSALLRGAIIVPWAVPGAVAGMVWLWMYNYHFGIIGQMLVSLGLTKEPLQFLGSSLTALPSVIVAAVWWVYPLIGLFFLAGLKSIPEELYDAAKVDGAGAFRRFLHITLPGLKAVTTVVVLLLVMWALNGFTLVYIMTAGGPAGATELIGLYIWRKAFVHLKFGQASAAAVLALLAMVAFTALYMRFIQKGEIGAE